MPGLLRRRRVHVTYCPACGQPVLGTIARTGRLTFAHGCTTPHTPTLAELLEPDRH